MHSSKCPNTVSVYAKCWRPRSKKGMRMISGVWKGVLTSLSPVCFPYKRFQGYVWNRADSQVGGEHTALSISQGRS